MAECSQARIAANRRNAEKSTGPRNTLSTRFNALKHGLLAEGITELDDSETYRMLCRGLEREYEPVGAMEGFLVRRTALCSIRVMRAARFEAECITAALNPATFDRTNSELAVLAARFQDPVLDLGLPASLPDSVVSSLGDTFSRYETWAENRLFRCLAELERLQSRRKSRSEVPSQPPNGR